MSTNIQFINRTKQTLFIVHWTSVLPYKYSCGCEIFLQTIRASARILTEVWVQCVYSLWHILFKINKLMYSQFITLNTWLMIASLNLLKNIITAITIGNNALQLHTNFLYFTGMIGSLTLCFQVSIQWANHKQGNKQCQNTQNVNL